MTDSIPAAPEEAVIIHLDGQAVADETKLGHDLAPFLAALEAALAPNALGTVESTDLHQTEATIHVYGPDAELIFAAVAPVLTSQAVSRNARVEVRKGPPGADQRDVLI
jgi:hypothetical protein